MDPDGFLLAGLLALVRLHPRVRLSPKRLKILWIFQQRVYTRKSRAFQGARKANLPNLPVRRSPAPGGYPLTRFKESGERTVWEIRLDWQYNSALRQCQTEQEARAYIDEVKQWHHGSIFLMEVHERIAERIRFKLFGEKMKF